MQTGKRITINQLAEMMQRAFNELHIEVKEQIKDVKAQISGVEVRLSGVEHRLDGVEHRLDIIEGKLTTNQENRISRLEDDVRIIKTKLENE